MSFKFVVNRTLPPISYLTCLVGSSFFFFNLLLWNFWFNLFWIQDIYIIGSMFFLFLVCSWHAAASLIQNIDLYASFSGYTYLTQQQYTSSQSTTAIPSYQSYFDSTTNQTMYLKNALTTAQRYDRIAVIVFMVIYLFFHFFFSIWMYLRV